MAGAALLLPAQGAVAKPGYEVQEAQVWSTFSVAASNGYRLTVTALREGSGRHASVAVTASRGPAGSRGQTRVEYAIRGTLATDGSIHASMGGLGRIAVRFRALKTRRLSPEQGCHGGRALNGSGVFRGVIRLRGEAGYTSVHAQHARGEVLTSPREVCGVSSGHEGKASPPVEASTLLAGAGRTDFQASRIDWSPGIASTDFSASVRRRRQGVAIWYMAIVPGEEADFTTPDPAGAMEQVTVEPPPPFTGSASFTLTSPSTSTWEGTLGVTLPVLGWVSLAGPSWWSSLCSETTCTHTAPQGVQIQTIH